MLPNVRDFPQRLRLRLRRGEPKPGRPNLVFQTAFLGDLLLSGALLREIKRQRPKSPLYLVARQGMGSLMRSLQFVDEVREVKKGDAESYRRVIGELSKFQFEWIFCPHPSLRSKLAVAGLRGDYKIGFQSLLAPFFFHATVPNRELPDALRQWSLVTAVAPQARQTVHALSRLYWNKKNQKSLLPSAPNEYSISARPLLLDQQPAVIVAPRTWAIFPGSVWATKQWSPAKFEKLAHAMTHEGHQILWMGGSDEAELCQRLSEAVPGSRSLAGHTNLFETLVVLSRCEGAIANDSGGQHLAATAGISVLTLFGPTTLNNGFRPWTSFCAVVETENLFCRPCGAHGHRECPRGTHECMERLEVAKVMEVFHNLEREAKL